MFHVFFFKEAAFCLGICGELWSLKGMKVAYVGNPRFFWLPEMVLGCFLLVLNWGVAKPPWLKVGRFLWRKAIFKASSTGKIQSFFFLQGSIFGYAICSKRFGFFEMPAFLGDLNITTSIWGVTKKSQGSNLTFPSKFRATFVRDH